MKITLVYPGISIIGFDSLGRGAHDTISVNLGMGYISSYLKENSKGHTVDLIDLRDLETWEHFEIELKARDPDVVGIHFNTINFEYGLNCARKAKKLNRIVIAGGPHATLAPDDLIRTGLIDTVIVGEGEVSFLKVIEDIECGKATERIIYGEKIENLDDIPFPDRDLYNMNRILNSPGIFPYPNRYIGIVASRGCYYNCSFCQPLERKIFGKKVRTRSVGNVIEEVKFVKEKYKANFIMFECDTLTTKKEWAMELCRKMKDMEIRWGAQSRVDTIDTELAEAMHDGGCMVIFFGFESGSERMLKLLRKGIKPEQSIKAGKICRESKMLIFANYMLGIPTETREDIELTFDMIKEIRPELHSPTYFSPIPGSDLYDFCKNMGIIKIDSYEGFIRNPINEKIKGIDYSLLDFYKKRILKYKINWYEEKHYFEYVFARWKHLLKKGYYKNIAKEFILNTPIIDKIPAIIRLIKGIFA
ncbi:MAG: B12-binding domain-containing radical SAM protein [Proteobacteria bacterium]|nr:B12-binding domain-containing radical SAM protein [Pseudomonadota bacterium]MBU4289063.1 B12-binding domain-containing radical SAM protein [Pseudomonadota bacterium]MBU4413729.1 B12-binding domain-containing radical SAM protein [Pseudomonadota bacterium]MCG2758120.1 B12-binding domain-containing radical SAM protein [Desulfobacteraceae bacterium]